MKDSKKRIGIFFVGLIIALFTAGMVCGVDIMDKERVRPQISVEDQFAVRP